MFWMKIPFFLGIIKENFLKKYSLDFTVVFDSGLTRKLKTIIRWAASVQKVYAYNQSTLASRGTVPCNNINLWRHTLSWKLFFLEWCWTLISETETPLAMYDTSLLGTPCPCIPDLEGALVLRLCVYSMCFTPNYEDARLLWEMEMYPKC